ncbi:hypothetical protein PC120_g18112 [Phytophthora cactorum]|nr:hypothetical protein PC120_g18112 [Phytophthora cactorum]
MYAKVRLSDAFKSPRASTKTFGATSKGYSQRSAFKTRILSTEYRSGLSISADSCAVTTLSKLLLDQYIDQCSDDSGYAFTTGVKPTAEEVAGMCASDA